MERTITWIAALIGLTIALALPAAYYFSARSSLDASHATEVEINARLVSQIISAAPELWQFQTNRLETLLQQRPGDGTRETRRVFDQDGKLIAASDDALPMPVIARRADVLDSGRVVGRLEITRSLRPTIIATAALALAGLLLAALTFTVLWALPLRALRQAVDDLVREREAGLRLQHEKDEADASARVHSQFLAHMSHEIRTPMNGVLGMTELLLQTNLDDKQRRFGETVMSSGKSLLRIIDDILDFSKMDAGKLALERIDFDPAELVEDVTQMLAANAMRKGVQLDCVVEQGVPARIVGDPARLRQVLANLAGNAVKFTEKGSVMICARRVIGRDGLDSALELSVADTGIGIAEAARARLFDRFAQGDTTTTRRFGGTGLGLAISRQLVEAMGGSLAVDSVQGRGSTFRVTLQIAPGAAPQTVSSIAPYLRVLVLEPAEGARQSLTAALKRLGVPTDVAADLKGARELMRAVARDDGRHNFMFVDGASAPALARELEPPGEVERRRRVLVLLTPIGTDAEELARRVGAAHILVKPIRSADVRALLSGAAKTVARPASPVEVAGRKNTGPLRVLLVEDNAVNQLVAKSMLKQLGVEFTAVGNGREAVEAVARAPFDVALMDCQMPEMDGFEATRAIRAREATAPSAARRLTIVALTANAMAEDRERCLSAGMDDHLAKPYSVDQLRQLLQRWRPAVAA